MIAVAAWIAKQERIRISERTLAGMDRARREGKRIGRPPLEQRQRTKISQLRATGLSLGKIAIKLHLPKSTVSTILGNRKAVH